MQGSNLSKVTSTAELKRLQRKFFEVISRPMRKGWRLSPDSSAEEMILPSATLNPNQRLELYAQQYWWRVIDSLADDFPGVRRLLGDKRFFAMLTCYMVKHPSRSYTLRNLGRALPSFLVRDKGIPSLLRPKASAVAEVEWAKIEAFDAPKLPPLTFEKLASPYLRLALQPHVQLIDCSYAVLDFLEHPKEPSATEGASNVRRKSSRLKGLRMTGRPPLRRAKSSIAVYRLGSRILLTALTPVERAFARELQRGGTLHVILTRLLKKYPRTSETEVQSTFQRLTELGLLAGKERSAKS